MYKAQNRCKNVKFNRFPTKFNRTNGTDYILPIIYQYYSFRNHHRRRQLPRALSLINKYRAPIVQRKSDIIKFPRRFKRNPKIKSRKRDRIASTSYLTVKKKILPPLQALNTFHDALSTPVTDAAPKEGSRHFRAPNVKNTDRWRSVILLEFEPTDPRSSRSWK